MKLPKNKPVEISCPECGAKLIVKENRHTGKQFLGCPRWPDCDHTQPIPESIIMRESGQQELFQ